MLGAILGAVGGGLLNLFGADKQSKAIDKTNKANQQIADETNRYNYKMWLESRGVTEDGKAVNTKMPRWAMVPSGGRAIGWANQGLPPTPTTPTTPTAPGAPAQKISFLKPKAGTGTRIIPGVPRDPSIPLT